MAVKLTSIVNKITHLVRLPKYRRNLCYARRFSIESTAMPKESNSEDTESETWGDETKTDVLFHETPECGAVTLNRPKSLNAINPPMAKRIIGKLMDWEVLKKQVFFEGSGEKAFCAGGDLSLLKYAHTVDVDYRRRAYFGTVYTLFHIVGTYNRPVITFMDNVTMGVGAGIALHSKYKIVTERSVFAMPEAAIGFYPDGGCSYVFPRLPGNLGLFLGLTCYHLKGLDIVKAGIATHFVPSEKLKDLKEELLTTIDPNIEKLIKKYQPTDLPDHYSLAPYLEQIDKCFSAPSVEEVFQRLEDDGSEWAKKILKTISVMSPTSLKVIHHVHQIGKNMTFTECIKMEYRLSCSFITPGSDFSKGALALTGKTERQPWSPASLAEVRVEDILHRFEPLHPEKELKL